MFLDDENEIFINDDVPETSEENEVETVASEEVDGVQTTEKVEIPEKVETNEEDIEKRIEERANKLVEEKLEKRLIRDRVKREREEAPIKAKYEELKSIMGSALGVDDIDEIINKSKQFYKEQGVQIPEIIQKSNLTERQEIVLAEDEAKTIISLGKQEMEEEANRIAAIPEKQRSVRDNIVFEDICKELVNMRDVEDFKNKGYDTQILQDKDFTNFRNQFTIKKPVSEIYEMYQTIRGTKPVQPASPGSAKTNTTNNEIKDYYTPEEVRQFTEEDLDNPKLMEAIDRSMLKWGKSR